MYTNNKTTSRKYITSNFMYTPSYSITHSYSLTYNYTPVLYLHFCPCARACVKEGESVRMLV